MSLRQTIYALRWPLAVLLSLAAAVMFFHRLGFMLTYQPTASMPKGFYFVYPSREIQRGNIVVFHAPKKIAIFLEAHHWLPTSGLMMKHVAALSGDNVCQRDNKLFINGHDAAALKNTYAPGHPLPTKHFCGDVKKDQFLALSTSNPKSYDGRYFGPVTRHAIVGKAVKL